ncbi:ABC transporter permease [Rhodobacteraceae bacterium N5(2021)]|uniref:ABC transporter permease n=1 Tax=Gymnodinialimonas phycosphaerae TaxID=2841589 RepID=A0A975TYD1_9RHOB|nr:ABC transporter permease [Gymnodinialimonas phycosphaerae]MBY4892552.1 ABC transporter permease [Gymnodinialimonas phycosphaerae]
MRRITGAILPVLVVVGVIVAIWYAAAYNMNRAWTLDQAERRALEITASDVFTDTMWQERPRLPAPHQVAIELWNTTAGEPMLRERRGELRPNPRSLWFHAFQTLAPTLLGFVIGTLAGMLLAVSIVHNRAMDMSVMPWAIASQTIPILAIAPIVIVVLNAVGLVGLVPKSLISAYLSFFPVVVGMVKGLRSPGAMDLDLLRTYSASRAETFWKLRLPASVPFLFASLKVGIAAALVGTIVAELPTGARFGLGARLLTGSYYGQTIQIWSALFMAAICAAVLVMILGAIERATLKRMGLDR